MSLRVSHPAKTSRGFLRQQGPVLLVCGLLLLLVLVIYWQTRTFTFLNYDDDIFVFKNSHVLQGLTWDNALWSLTAGIGKDAKDADFWRPLSLMSHMLDVSWFGLNAGAHHLMSVAIHGLTAVGLFLILRLMTSTFWRSAFVAALFAVHPLHVESVAWVAERKDVLSGLFFVLALGAYRWHVLRSFRWGSYLLMLLMAALAMMSKPMLVTLPGVLLLVDLWPLNRIGAVPLKRLLLEKIPLFVMSAAVAGFTLSGHGAVNDVIWAKLPWYYRVGNALLSYGIYIRQTLWPTGLSCFYPYAGVSYFVPGTGCTLSLGQIVLSVVVLLSITAMVAWQRKKTSLVVGWLWYLGMLLPVIGLFTQAGDQAHADRYTYLAMIGLSLMVAWPAVEWAGTRLCRRVALGSTAVLALAVLTVAAEKQVAHWHDNVSLWSHAVACDPADYASQANLGNAFVAAGRMEDSVSSYQRALKISPLFARANLNVGITLLGMGRLPEAEDHLRRVLVTEPNLAEAHSALASVLLRKGELEPAVSHYGKAASIAPDAANCSNLGNALLQSGNFPKAIENYLRAIAADPKHTNANFGLGMAYAALGQRDVAAGYYQKVLAENPQYLPAINNLAWLLATSSTDSLRNGAQALVLAQQALHLPGGSKVHLLHTLAAAYAETGEFDQAAQIALQAATMASTQGDAALAQQLLKERHAYLVGVPWRE
ncbi:MAG: Tetratricopeptide 2 repeat protein [Prosthecobacter sp.]|nr:Tetratricopeptide 2 repeat protein [Prosthecobacter sp.]